METERMADVLCLRFGNWTEIFGDASLTVALLGQLTRRGPRDKLQLGDSPFEGHPRAKPVLQ